MKKSLLICIIIVGIVLISGCTGQEKSTDSKTSTYTPTPTITPTPIKTTSSSSGSTITNSIGMDFVLIPTGEFNMGSPSNDVGRFDSEGPVHHVKISNAFYMGKYEVTQKQWRDIMGSSPSYFKGDNLPVEQVSWNDVQDFIKKFNEKEGGNKYRLPTEAEWEYSARAGTTTRYSFGDDESMLGDYAWYVSNSGTRQPKKGDYFGYDKDDLLQNIWNGKTHPVGEKKPNPWGLYDMYGNVLEWVQDSANRDYNGAPTDGSSWEGSGSYRVFRGGGWNDFAGGCRSASRYGYDPVYRGSAVGFRLLRVS
jgi:formylglycine-generating enzyme required for sulfatase activity